MASLADELGIKLGEAEERIKDAISEHKKSVEAVITEKTDSLVGRVETLESNLSAISQQKFGVSLTGLGDSKELKNFSFAKFLKGVAFDRIDSKTAWKDAEFERDITKQVTEKALSEGVDISGGFLVPVEVMESLFIELLRNKLVLNTLGARELRNLSGTPIEIPGQSGGATAYWLGENEAPTASQQAFDKKEMTPRRLGCLVKVSNRLLALASPSVDALIREDMTAVMTRALQGAIIWGVDPGGANSNKRPRSIINTPGIQSYTIANPNGGVLNFDDIDNMVGLLEDVDADGLGTPTFLFHNRVKRRLKKLKVSHYAGQTTEQDYLLGRPPMSDSQLQDWIGYGFSTTNQIPANLVKGASNNLSYVIAAIWNQLLIGYWRNMTFKASNITGDNSGSAFTQNQTWIMGEMEVDSIIRHPEAFVVASDAAA